MECLIGLKCDDFVIIAHDNKAGRSILTMKQDQDKLFKLDKNIGMVVCGEPGDTSYFGEYIQKRIALYGVRNGYSLSPHATANFTRNVLSDHIRSRHPYSVNVLMGGYDSTSKKSSLYYMDYLGTMVELPFGAHGYGSFFILGIMDKYHRSDLSISEAEWLLKKCFMEIQERFSINLPAFSYYIIGKDGLSEKKVFHARDKEPTVLPQVSSAVMDVEEGATS